MIPPRLWGKVPWTLFRTFGWRGLLLRSSHEARRFAGRFRSRPRYRLQDPSRVHSLFEINFAELRGSTRLEDAVARSDRVSSGYYHAFRDQWRSLPTSCEGWGRHPKSGEVWDNSTPWWRTQHLDPNAGDVKDLWEPARFGWVYDLVRGWVLSEDDRYAQAFHRYFQDWLRNSPPYYGPHWSCGQEVAIRAVALLYAEANLGSAPSSNEANLARVAEILAASGERIADAIGYALSQRNNHAISEATGLVLLGVRFAGSHPDAPDWLERGHRLLELLVGEQFARDGWYAQHSFTYQ